MLNLSTSKIVAGLLNGVLILWWGTKPSVLLIGYSPGVKVVGMGGFEPPLCRFSYHYNFHYTFLFCGLDFLFIITFLF